MTKHIKPPRPVATEAAPRSAEEMLAEIHSLRQSLDEAQQTLHAISAGEVDAVLIENDEQSTVLTLGTADSPYRMMVEQAPQASALVSPDGLILQANAAFAKLMQRKPQELAGTPLSDLAEAASLDALTSFVAAGGENDVEAELILRNRLGQRLPLSLGLRPLRDNPAGLCLLLTDHTEARLRDRIISEEILAQSILEQVADAIIVCDASGRIVRASRAVEAMIGADPLQGYFDEVVPLKAWIDGNDAQGLGFRAIMESGNIRGWDVEYTDPRGNSFNLLLSVGFLFGPEGAPRGAVITLTDITARKRVESALELADRRKNEFLAILAHELRNPLAPISNSVSILSSGKLAKEVQDQALSMMDRQVQHMVRLVDNLMDVSRITRGKVELKKERVNLNEVLQVAIETSNPLIAQFNHTLVVERSEAPIWVHADFTRLSQIFSNLLNNAAKYSLPEGEIRIFSRIDGDFVTVHIADKGIGIRPEMLSRVFDMFAQVDDTLERAHGGLGVGLTLVKTLTEMHGGTVTASSAGPDLGSEFVVRLPVTRAEAAQKDASGTSESGEHGNMRVMIVEDNDALAQTTGWLVEMLGYEYRLARSGPDAIAKVGDYRPDVMMLDIGLPGMNGYDLCRHLRQEPDLSQTVFIAQTGWGQDEHRQMAREAGFHHHMVKPLSFDALESLLGSIEKGLRQTTGKNARVHAGLN